MEGEWQRLGYDSARRRPRHVSARGRWVGLIDEGPILEYVLAGGGIFRLPKLDTSRCVVGTTGGEEHDSSENPSWVAHRGKPMLDAMTRAQIERRLRSVSEQLKSARNDLGVTDEQLIQLAGEADDARLRALVSETPIAEKEYRKASRHAERLRKHRDRLQVKIAGLDAEQDELLDRLTAS